MSKDSDPQIGRAYAWTNEKGVESFTVGAVSQYWVRDNDGKKRLTRARWLVDMLGGRLRLVGLPPRPVLPPTLEVRAA